MLSLLITGSDRLADRPVWTRQPLYCTAPSVRMDDNATNGGRAILDLIVILTLIREPDSLRKGMAVPR